VPGIVLTDRIDLISNVTDALDAGGLRYEALPDGLSADEVADKAADADVLILALLAFPRSAIERLRHVGLLIRLGIGVDLIDVDAATERGIWVANVPDYCVDEVADQAVLVMLAGVRQTRRFQEQLGRHWAKLDFPAVHRLRGRTLGIIGLGRIGSAVAHRALAFGLEVIATDPYIAASRFAEVGARRVDLAELISVSDIISIHTPLTAETHHLLDGAAFRSMRDGVVIVNVSRGPLVDLQALDDALERGKVEAAGLDVVEGEPSPDMTQPIFGRSNVFVSPHIAWYSLDARRELGQKAVDEAVRYMRGERPLNLVNPIARSAATPGALLVP